MGPQSQKVAPVLEIFCIHEKDDIYVVHYVVCMRPKVAKC